MLECSGILHACNRFVFKCIITIIIIVFVCLGLGAGGSRIDFPAPISHKYMPNSNTE